MRNRNRGFSVCDMSPAEAASKRVSEDAVVAQTKRMRLDTAPLDPNSMDIADDDDAAAAAAIAAAASARSSSLPQQRPCIVGRAAPSFSNVPAVLPDGQLGRVSLSDFNGRYLLLLFYPADFTFVCPTELTAFSDRVSEFAAVDCSLAVCSTDSEFAHYNWRQQARISGGIGALQLPMLADRTRNVSRAYGVLCEQSGQAFRGLFIIDRQQRLRIAAVNDMPVGRSVDEALRLVQALRFSDTHGEVCPADWQPGSETIIPDIRKSKSYFGKI
ncbi:Peroxiredoxin-1 [Coemansia brasiliensis]|uniref:thioredoxin-dependent peroxiredoxin n=1 Tax=Coemansia brasiliensis TaxID=2650707 RepID=A0A9W8I3D0_9FUNG|nr:Peroxiredoxin-1 [Coemansia brasiliensis]